MKKTLYVLLCLLQISQLNYANSGHHTKTPLEKIKFENAILKLIDGMPFCMDGDNIKKVVILTAVFKHMLYGIDPKTKKNNPRYHFRNSELSVAELTSIEANNPSAEDRIELAATLDEAINDLYKQVTPFLIDAHNSLEYNLVLVEEWMEKTGRMDTNLYDIHHVQEDELAYLQQRMKSFESLSILLEDLISYFESLIHSCPKGVAQFKEIMKKRHASQ